MDFTALLSLAFYFLIIIPSAIIHEYAHGWMADRLGDPTARYAGRMTLNPKAHIDLWGTILMPLFLMLASGGSFAFGYAKPVPYNPYNLRNQKWGPAFVGLAGPMANLLLALVFALAVRLLLPYADSLGFGYSLMYLIVRANLTLMLFNLIPLPPLDGSKVLYALLPDSGWAAQVKIFLQRYSFALLLFVVFFLFDLLIPLVNVLERALIG